MRVTFATEPAPGRLENEDAAFHRGDLVGVLDGVSAPPGVDTGCVHGPAWYVRRLADRLQRTATDPAVALVDALAAAIDAVRVDHGGRCELEHSNTPAATVALARATGDELEYLLLCDAYLVLDDGNRVRVVTDDRFAAAVADIRQVALAGATTIGTDEHDDRVRRAALLRQERTNQPGGYWIAAALPAAAYEAVTGRAPLAGPGRLRRAALLTDGASAAVDRYGLLTWADLLDVLTEHGPGELIGRVRAAEHADRTGERQPRYKRHDDATALLCEFEEVGRP